MRINKVKLISEQNPGVLEVNCAKNQAPTQANRSDSQPPSHQLFEHSLISLPNSKVKFFRGTPCQTSDYSIQKTVRVCN